MSLPNGSRWGAQGASETELIKEDAKPLSERVKNAEFNHCDCDSCREIRTTKTVRDLSATIVEQMKEIERLKEDIFKADLLNDSNIEHYENVCKASDHEAKRATDLETELREAKKHLAHIESCWMPPNVFEEQSKKLIDLAKSEQRSQLLTLEKEKARLEEEIKVLTNR
jgi:hypothetical protein